MDKKIVFFDIDGTLIDHHTNEIPSSTIDAIDQLHKNGVLVGIATGRAPKILNGINEKINADLLVTINGQFVLYHDEVIFDEPHNLDTLVDIFRIASENNIPYGGASDDYSFVSDLNHPRIQQALNQHNLPNPHDGDNGEWMNHHIYQGWVFAREEEMHLFEGIHDDVYYIRWAPAANDIHVKVASKAHGIKEVIKKLDIPMENVYALGDGLNDYQMIDEVGFGIAMGNAHEDIKEIADYVTDDVDKDGVYKALKHFNLI
jgi:Cof subfamily protein (haloacid dehalogenase superfamily)